MVLPNLSTEEILDGIRQWIEIESPSDDLAALARMADKVTADYEAIGAHVTRIAGTHGAGDHLLVTQDRHCPPEAKDGPGILILSHIDTVHPIGTLAGPLPYRVDGDRAYGPGAEDMKGGAYIALAAIRQLGRDNRRTHLPIRHLMVSDEEIGSASAKPHIIREAQRAKYVLVTEPARSGGKIVTARKGIANFHVSAHGEAAHAGVEHHLGANAILEIAHQIVALEAMTDYDRDLTVNVGQVRGGIRDNVVPDQASITVDIRFPSPAIGDDIVERVRALAPRNPKVRLVVEGGINRPGYEKTPDIAALFEHAKGLAAEIGFDLVDLKTGGGSDGNYTAAYAPTLDGLGVDGDGGHTLDERLYISSIVPRTLLLMRLMETLK
ncbi:MAG: M20 family metallopeptidase [Sphingomonadales bacterium]|jgi:glutamate carboxypeptidase